MIRGKPDISKFLKGGSDVITPSNKKSQKKEQERQKAVFLPVRMLSDIKRRALDETEKGTQRITESDIIRRALESYLYK